MPILIFLTFLFYIGTLAITQTAHGGSFMSLRWIALAMLTVVSLVYWLLGRIPRRDGLRRQGGPPSVWVYLLATLASLATAENQLFSGLRWLTQAMLIITFVVLLRGSYHARAAGQIIWVFKGITIALICVSFFYPAPPKIYENPFFRGAMGDSNSLGHIAMLCALVFLHGAIVSPKPWGRILHLMIAMVASGVLLFSWARSSMVALLVGLVLLNSFYGLTRSYLMKSVALMLACLLLASPMIQSKILQFATKDRQGKEQEQTSQIVAVIKGDFFKKGPSFETVLETRSSLWYEAWEGFKQRPFLGWGFGANQGIQIEWDIRSSSTGLVRDITNDALLILEGNGIIGFIAYVGLMISVFKQSLTRRQMMRVRNRANRKLEAGEKRINRVDCKEESAIQNHGISIFRTQEVKKPESVNSLVRDHRQAILYIISISLFALFLTDGSAFSAGSLLSTIFWISAGAAGTLRAEAIAAERVRNRAEERGLMTVERRVKRRRTADRAEERGQSPLKERPSILRSVPPLAGLEERAKGA